MVKILIGVPTHKGQKYCLDEFLEGIKNQTITVDKLFVVNNGESAYATYIKSKGYNAVECPTKAKNRFDHILNARNHIREHVLKNNYDYLLFVDSDVILHPQTLEILLRMKKEIATGVYLNAFTLAGKPVIAPVLFKDKGGGEAQLYTYRGMFPAREEEIGAAGLGCCLIRKEVLQKVTFRLMPHGAGEDMAFFVDARAQGYKAYAQTGVRLTHRPYPTDHKLAPLYEWRTMYEDNVIEIDLSKKDGNR